MPFLRYTECAADGSIGCPPELEEQYVCPYNLADDDGSLFDQSQLACGVVAADGFQGYCVYNMDGTDSAGTLYLDGGNVQYSRPVNYGDGSDDDCPPVSVRLSSLHVSSELTSSPRQRAARVCRVVPVVLHSQ